MGVPLPPPAVEHTGRVLFNPTAPWEASEVDLVIGVDPGSRYVPEALDDSRAALMWRLGGLRAAPPDLLPERPPMPAWVPPEELLLPPGWQEVRAGRSWNMVVMYDASKFEGTPVTFPDIGVFESLAYGSDSWCSEGEYTAVLLTSKHDPSLRLLVLAATGLHLSSHACYWQVPAYVLSDLLSQASHLNGIPALAGSLSEGSLAGSGYLAETAPAGTDGEAVPAGSVAALAAAQPGDGGGDDVDRGGAVEELALQDDDDVGWYPGESPETKARKAAWLTGVLLPPDEMAWRRPPLLRPLQGAEQRLARSHPHVFGIGPFQPAHFLFSTPRSASQDRWPALHLSNVHRSQEGQLAADYTLTHH